MPENTVIHIFIHFIHNDTSYTWQDKCKPIYYMILFFVYAVLRTSIKNSVNILTIKA